MTDEPETPFDHPRRWWERLFYPTARLIWLEGFRTGTGDG